MSAIHQVALYILFNAGFQAVEGFFVTDRAEFGHVGLGEILVFVADVGRGIDEFDAGGFVYRGKDRIGKI